MNITRKITAICLSLIMTVLLFACREGEQPPKKEPIKKPNESFLKYGETNETIVELSKVTNSIWVHTSYFEENGVLVPANGLIVVADNSLVLIDTPWTDKQMESLDKLVHEAFKGGFSTAIVTHAHPDRMGGAGYLQKKKIPIASLEIVAEKAKEKGLVIPDQVSKADSVILDLDNTDFEIFFPGEGHSSDNTVVWIEKYNVLYAGCLVKELGSNSLGNISEADLNAWPTSIEVIKEKYQNIDIVIPGHGQWGDTSLIDYTLELLEE